MESLPPIIPFFADRAALAYHEARNVRHLVHRDTALRPRFEALIRGLPKNREEAWVAVQSVRSAARTEASAARAEQAFASRFGVGLSDLLELFRHPAWKDSAAGGNKWASITESVLQLRAAIEAGDDEAVGSLVERLRTARHNTGFLQEKLDRLDAYVRSRQN
jgi:hypothetical protein